ncbi:MAG: methyltransferase RsmF C-terminal domain-like protein, partial [[Clostridium] leptum]
PDECRQVLNLTAEDPRVKAFLHGEEIDAPGFQGFAGISVEGVMTGFGKCSGGRMKNRYPKGLRTL